mgnify:FL=1
MYTHAYDWQYKASTKCAYIDTNKWVTFNPKMGSSPFSQRENNIGLILLQNWKPSQTNWNLKVKVNKW